jgi:hypothetical protein
MNHGLLLQDQKKLLKFNSVYEEVTRKADLNLPDVTIEMTKVKIANTGAAQDVALDVPGQGTFCMTHWARSQMGSYLGIQWDKWFNPKAVNSRDIQEEVQKRFRQSGESKKLRLCRFNGAEADAKLKKTGYDGYVRAVLGPTYASIDDVRVFDRIAKSFRNQLDSVHFMKNHMSKTSHWGNDHCTYYSMIGEPVNLGPIDRLNSNVAVRRIYDLAEREGKLPDADWVYPGFQLRNSEVGYTAVQINEFLFRLVCLNGAIICTGESKLMYRTHRPIEDVILDQQLHAVFSGAPARWKLTEKNIKILSGIVLQNPVAELEHQLLKMDVPKSFIKLATEAFEKEPLPTMYGVLQAITRAAQQEEDMDKRFDLESLGGRLINSAPRLQAAA